MVDASSPIDGVILAILALAYGFLGFVLIGLVFESRGRKRWGVFLGIEAARNLTLRFILPMAVGRWLIGHIIAGPIHFTYYRETIPLDHWTLYVLAGSQLSFLLLRHPVMLFLDLMAGHLLGRAIVYAIFAGFLARTVGGLAMCYIVPAVFAIEMWILAYVPRDLQLQRNILAYEEEIAEYMNGGMNRAEAEQAYRVHRMASQISYAANRS